LSQKISFSQWDDAISLLTENFTQITNWLD